MDLFAATTTTAEGLPTAAPNAPLAVRMRPASLAEGLL